MTVDERIFQFIVVVAQIHDDIVVPVTLLDAQAVGERSRDPVVDHHLQGDDLDLAAELFLVAQRADVMGLDPVLVQVVQQNGGDLVVQGALALEAGPLDVVEGHRHVLVAEDHLVGMVGGENLLLVSLED